MVLRDPPVLHLLLHETVRTLEVRGRYSKLGTPGYLSTWHSQISDWADGSIDQNAVILWYKFDCKN
jgi:hypothetical protein